MDKMWIDGVLSHLRNDPHNSTISAANDCNNWLVAMSEEFEVLEALLPIFAHVVKEEAELAS
jgi:hypothetical protein